MRGLLRRLVAIRIEPTNEINFMRGERTRMTSFHFPLNCVCVCGEGYIPGVVFQDNSLTASDCIILCVWHAFIDCKLWHQNEQRYNTNTSTSLLPLCHWYIVLIFLSWLKEQSHVVSSEVGLISCISGAIKKTKQTSSSGSVFSTARTEQLHHFKVRML